MKARVKTTGEIIEVNESFTIENDRYYPLENAIYHENELDFTISEPEEEVTIEGLAAKCLDGITRVYISYGFNSFILPSECNIEGEVTITIKLKKQ